MQVSPRQEATHLSYMQIEWDVAITMDDGLVLRADVFRPPGDGPWPVLMSYGPYGKGLAFQEGYSTAWEIMLRDHPDTARNSSNHYQNWEVVDPEKWVPYGYVCIRVDSRGAGRSPGELNLHSARETQDLIDCIQWAGTQRWSNGRVGLAGVSFYASNQWRVAARRPPHLAAICVWEGYNDRYRESARHGGILCTFTRNWQQMQVVSVQHGRGERGPKSRVTGELVCGPETLSEEELAALRVDMWGELQRRELHDDYYQSRTPDLEEIQVPLLSAANWGGQGLHTRGNIEGFLRAGSTEKWLEVHGGSHWAGFYTDYGVDLQRRFFDRFLKMDNTGWQHQPKVQLQIRHADGSFTQRAEDAWPIDRTCWTRFYLDATLGMHPTSGPTTGGRVTYETMGHGVTFRTLPFEMETEITGNAVARLKLSSATCDADLFLVLRLFDRMGQEVVFQGALDPHTPLAQGWLRASHRQTDPSRSLAWRPWHSHNSKELLEPGVPVHVDVEIWPTSIVIPAGYSLGLTVRGKDYEYDGPAASLSNMKNPMRGCGPFVHDDPQDRPAAIFDTSVTLHMDAEDDAYLLLPIIPKTAS